MRRCTALVSLCLALAPATLGAKDLPPYLASDAHAPAVTPKNLLASERFWPYQVTLTRASGAPPVAAGTTGVLIRVESETLARIDFGRDGLRTVPIADTDLAQLAERVRRGELEKRAPNFVFAIGPRLLDAASEPLRPVSYEAVMERRAFLVVFADPLAESFAELAAALAPLKDRHGVLTILFPQGGHSDARVLERLRAASWKPAFVFAHLTEPYTKTLIDGITPRPTLMLQTNEGRVLFQSPWQAGVAETLAARMAEAFDRKKGTDLVLEKR
jgi:hypothetical protein